MPTLDFFGYSPQQAREMLERMAPELRALPFAADIVFVLHEETSSVVDLDGLSKPFIRISTRDEGRAQSLVATLRPYADLETTRIWQFHPFAP